MDSQGRGQAPAVDWSACRRRAKRRWWPAALVAVVTMLSACGATSGSPGSSGTPSVVQGSAGGKTPRVDATDHPTSIPFAPAAPAAFESRARLLVDKLRTSGALDRYAATLALTSPRILRPHLSDPALESAFSGYEFTAGAGVTGPARRGTVTMPDGATQHVEIRSAPDLLVDLIRHGIGCHPGRLCPTVTRATLGTAVRATTRGPATVPVWQFWADGMDQPYEVVAATEDSLPDLERGHQFDDYFRGGLGAEWARPHGDHGVVVGVAHGSCSIGLGSHVLETTDVVVVGGSEGEYRGSCDLAGHATASAIPLRAPLGLRPVVDVNTGRFLTQTM